MSCEKLWRTPFVRESPRAIHNPSSFLHKDVQNIVRDDILLITNSSN